MLRAGGGGGEKGCVGGYANGSPLGPSKLSDHGYAIGLDCQTVKIQQIWECSVVANTLGPVVQKPINTNPGLNV